jgi:hypothetical protein
MRRDGKIVAVSVLCVAGLAALGAAPAAAPGSAAAPTAGTPCAKVVLPGGTRVPDQPGCVVADARYTAELSVVTWKLPEPDSTSGAEFEKWLADPKGAMHGGIVAEEHDGPKTTPLVLGLGGEVRILQIGDVTGDGREDVVVYDGSDASSPMAAHIFGRRTDGFGDLGNYPGYGYAWKPGGFTVHVKRVFAHDTFGPDDTFTFAGNRFVRTAPGPALKRVTGLKLTATKSSPKHPATFAIDGKLETTWAGPFKGEGKGETLTITLPSAIELGRLSFATGWDWIDPTGKDRFWDSAHVMIADSDLGDGSVKKLDVDPGERWIDYIPSESHTTNKITIKIGVQYAWGKTGPGSYVNELEVWERVK